jgi:hypothetical protein
MFDKAHHSTPGSAAPARLGGFTLDACVRREEARLALEGPGLADWLTSIEPFLLPDLTTEWTVRAIRAARDGNDPGRPET